MSIALRKTSDNLKMTGLKNEPHNHLLHLYKSRCFHTEKSLFNFFTQKKMFSDPICHSNQKELFS